MRGPAPPENQRGVAEPTNRNAEARSHPPMAGRVVATPRGARMRREYDGGGDWHGSGRACAENTTGGREHDVTPINLRVRVEFYEAKRKLIDTFLKS